MDHVKDEPVEGEELISVIEIEEHFIKPDPACTDAMEESLEEPQFVICSPEQDCTYEASDNDLDFEADAIPIVSTTCSHSRATRTSTIAGKNFPCDKCDMTLDSKVKLDSHIKLHHDSAKFSCSQCKRHYYSKSALSSHMVCEHVYSKLHSCSVCFEKFPTQNKLKLHVFETQHYCHLCTVCQKRFHDKETLKSHLTEHSSILSSNLICDECGHLFNKKSSIRTHIRISHLGARFQCSICGIAKSFKSNKRLHQHFKNQHSLTHPTSIKLCTVISNSPSSTPSKMKQILFAPKFLNDETLNSCNVYECEWCHQKFTTNLKLMFHIQVHNKTEPMYNCTFCDSKYMSQPGLKRHIDTNHLNVRYDCNLCKNSFKSKFNLKMHKKKIHGIAVKIVKKSKATKLEYKCEFCDKSYHSSSYYLNRHMKRAHLKPYVCNICNKKFGDKNYLQNHKLIHGKDSKLKCDFCKTIFLSKKLIFKHILAHHLGRKKYKCSVCEKMFRFRSSLNSHKNRTHGVKH